MSTQLISVNSRFGEDRRVSHGRVRTLSIQVLSGTVGRAKEQIRDVWRPCQNKYYMLIILCVVSSQYYLLTAVKVVSTNSSKGSVKTSIIW